MGYGHYHYHRHYGRHYRDYDYIYASGVRPTNRPGWVTVYTKVSLFYLDLS